MITPNTVSVQEKNKLNSERCFLETLLRKKNCLRSLFTFAVNL